MATMNENQTVYYGPGSDEYESSGSVDRNETVTVLWKEKSGTWCYIEYRYGNISNKKRGYVPSSTVNIGTTESVATKVTTLAPRYVQKVCSTYFGPGTSGYVVTDAMFYAMEVTYLGTKDGCKRIWKIFWCKYSLHDYQLFKCLCEIPAGKRSCFTSHKAIYLTKQNCMSLEFCFYFLFLLVLLVLLSIIRQWTLPNIYTSLFCSNAMAPIIYCLSTFTVANSMSFLLQYICIQDCRIGQVSSFFKQSFFCLLFLLHSINGMNAHCNTATVT